MTGAAGGIGSAVAARLRDAGAHVTGVDRGPSPGCDDWLVADLADPAELSAVAGQLKANCPDILVNVAGILRFGLHERQKADELTLCYTINLAVPAVLASAVAGPMRARGHGQIVNIGSVLGAIPYPWFAAYSSSKAGLSALSQGLRRELAGCGVAVTHVDPRAARTAFNNSEVNRFLEATGMKADDPEWVVDRITRAILKRKAHVTLGAAERVFAMLNAVLPALVDAGLNAQIKRALPKLFLQS